MNTSQAPLTRAQLRKQLRQKRRALSPYQQRIASQKLARSLFQANGLWRSRRIALYLAGDGEIDPKFFAKIAKQRGYQLYLPSLHPVRKGHLWFGDIAAQRCRNRFGIAEPNPRFTKMLTARQLDCVLMPLVGFDVTGARLGMGGGFYDRTLAFKQPFRQLKPKLLGLAHHFQQVVSLPIEPWDIPLDAIVTDQQWINVG